MGRNTVRLLAVIVTAVAVAGCDYRTERGYVTRRNVDEYVERLELSGTIDHTAVIRTEYLADLEEYLTAVRDDYYPEQEERYSFHMALIGLRQAEFYDSFQQLHDLIDDPRYTALVHFHIAEAIRYQFNTRYANLLYGRAVLATRDTFPEPLTIGQHIRAMANNGRYPYFQMAPYLPDELLEHPELESFVRRQRLHFTQDPSTIDPDAILGRNLLTQVSEEFVLDLIERTGGAQYAYDYAAAYYSQPYVGDYERAAAYADLVDYRDWVENLHLPHSRITMLVRVYIGVGQYERALEIYDYHADRFHRDGESVLHTNLIRAAAYAGLDRGGEAFAALQREFAITEIRGDGKGFRRTGDMLESLYEYFFVFDEFERYRDTEWEERMIDVIEENMARYHDLPIFRRQLPEE